MSVACPCGYRFHAAEPTMQPYGPVMGLSRWFPNSRRHSQVVRQGPATLRSRCSTPAVASKQSKARASGLCFVLVERCHRRDHHIHNEDRAREPAERCCKQCHRKFMAGWQCVCPEHLVATIASRTGAGTEYKRSGYNLKTETSVIALTLQAQDTARFQVMFRCLEDTSAGDADALRFRKPRRWRANDLPSTLGR